MIKQMQLSNDINNLKEWVRQSNKEANKIYAIMVIEDISTESFPNDGFKGDTRIVGWYSDKDTALEMVKINNGDIHEYLYKYALVEEIKEGLYEPAFYENRWFFKYNDEKGKYEPCEEPKSWKCVCGFTIG